MGVIMNIQLGAVNVTNAGQQVGVITLRHRIEQGHYFFLIC